MDNEVLSSLTEHKILLGKWHMTLLLTPLGKDTLFI